MRFTLPTLLSAKKISKLPFFKFEIAITILEIFKNKNMELKRELGLFSAVNLIINTTIGAGIFVSPAVVYRFTGSVALCLIIWIFAGLMSLIGKKKTENTFN